MSKFIELQSFNAHTHAPTNLVHSPKALSDILMRPSFSYNGCFVRIKEIVTFLNLWVQFTEYSIYNYTNRKEIRDKHVPYCMHLQKTLPTTCVFFLRWVRVLHCEYIAEKMIRITLDYNKELFQSQLLKV